MSAFRNMGNQSGHVYVYIFCVFFFRFWTACFWRNKDAIYLQRGILYKFRPTTQRLTH